MAAHEWLTSTQQRTAAVRSFGKESDVGQGIYTQGLGPRVPALNQATANSLRDAILEGLRGYERFSQAAKQLAVKLREENGVAQVVAFLTAGL